MCFIGDVCVVFIDNCVVGIEVNVDRINKLWDELFMLVMVFNFYIGYDNVVKIVKKVYKEGMILKEVVISLGLLMEE